MKHLRYLFFFATFLVNYLSFAQVIRGTYAIQNAETGLLLRIKDANKKDGTTLVAYSPINWKCMTWDFQHVEGQTYRLKNLFTGKTFQPERDSTDSAGLIQQPLGATRRQQYEFIATAEKTYLIRQKGTSLYLTTSGGTETINAPVILAEMNNTKRQQWTIYEQHPTM
jgi:hypothetical protein